MLRLAALLHDIGKFHQRTLDHPKKNHPELGAEFAKKGNLSFLSDLVLNHHSPANAENQELAKILQKADWISAAERLEEEGGKRVVEEPLRSIFSKVNIGKGDGYDSGDYYYPLDTLRLDESIFPEPEKSLAMEGGSLEHRYRELWYEGFLDEFDRITIKNDGSCFISLFYLLQRYTSFMPSAAYKHFPEIALFDHLRTTSAIADCLYKSGGSENFLLIRGDISGVQNFIYDVYSPEEAQEGMSKRLRGRSFYLSLLTETLAHCMLGSLDLSISNLLWCGGGEFQILAPDTERSRVKLSRLEEEINESLFGLFQGKLYLALGRTETDGEKLQGNFSDLMEEVAYECSVKKNKKFDEVPDIFEPKSSEGVCPICGSDFSPEGVSEFCESCENQEELGWKLPRAEYIVEVKSPEEGLDHEFDVQLSDFGIYWDILEDENSVLGLLEELEAGRERIQSAVVYRLNETDFLTNRLTEHLEKSSLPLALGFKFLANTTPYDGSKVLSFSEIAENARGSDLIGVLRMDVDDLGAVFGVGLRATEMPATISRIATLSRLLDIFFLGYLNKICENFSDPDNRLDSLLYVTYSGGDDLFIVGPWDVVMGAADELNEKFREYTCRNPNVSISAGLYHCKPRFPIGRAARYAGEELDSKSKELGKDSITAFGETVKWLSEEYSGRWNGYRELLEYGKRLEDLILNDRISKSFVYSMLAFREKTFSEVAEEEGQVPLDVGKQKKSYMPDFKYLLARNINVDRDAELFEEIDETVPKIVPWARIPVSWASLATR